MNGILKDDKNWWVRMVTDKLDSIMEASISEVELTFDIATPHIPSGASFVTDYVEYKRYECGSIETVAVSGIRNDTKKTNEIKPDIYTLGYMPNSIYLWVAPNTATMYDSGQRCMLSNTYAQITGVKIDYGNLSKLMYHYTERDLYQMALCNGLEDRTYADWARTNRVFCHAKPVYPAPVGLEDFKMLDLGDNHEFFGVGSVLHIIPYGDICTGDELTFVGGMRLTNETIRFTVNYRPLDVFNDNIKYSLYVAFEYNGVVTITPGYCDIAMIHIDSYNQLAQAEIAPAYRINRVYGKGLWDKTKKFFWNAHTFTKR